MEKSIYKTVILVEVLSEEPIDDNMSIDEIIAESYDGSYSMVTNIQSSEQIKGKVAAEAVIKQGSDPEFFNMDSEGEVIEEDEIEY